jgi:hypothetical protein
MEVTSMKFAQRVFAGAGIWGLLVVPPLFFLFDTVGRLNPPAINHPEYYYGFAAITSAWQVAFLVMASDPLRYRPLMPVAILEKLGWVVTVTVLYAQDRVAANALPLGAADMVLGILFAISFVKTAR